MEEKEECIDYFLGVKGTESLARGWIAPLYLNTSFFKNPLVTLTTLLPSSIEGLMGLWEEQPSSSFKGLELSDESPPFKWEWSSEPLDCPPDERCKPESMVGMMSPLGGNPRSSERGGSQINENERCSSKHEGQLMLKLLLDLISAALLVVYIFAELGHLPIVNFAFAAMGMTIPVLSYLYLSSTSLDTLFLFTSIRKMVVEKWKKRQAG